MTQIDKLKAFHRPSHVIPYNAHTYSAIVTVSKVNNNNGRNTIAKNSQFIHAILSLKTPPADEKNEVAALKLR